MEESEGVAVRAVVVEVVDAVEEPLEAEAEAEAEAEELVVVEVETEEQDL